ncbi:MAG: radical SAM protein [Planctomycetota bacterium]|nr:radical SAM protein [Planctomycetota bacterium]
MKFIATISVDLDESPMGLRSRLGDEIAGRPVLRRTVERVLRADRIDSVHILSPVSQSARVKALVDGLDVRLETHAEGKPGYAKLVRAGRVWGMDGWRGGIGTVCVFDEDINVPLVDALVRRESADAAISIAAGGCLVDSALIDAMIVHHEAHGGALTFVQAPPGLGVVILGSGLLPELASSGQPPGLLLAYRPDQPGADLTGKEACFRPPASVVEAGGRLICDSRRAFERVAALFADGAETWNAERIARWLLERRANHVEAVPEEIEIELTTDDPSDGGSLLHPRVSAGAGRGPISLDVVRAVIDSIDGYDDVRIVLGGFGEPCLHPRFAEICGMLRNSAVAAIAVRTDGTVGDPVVEDALFETPIDAVEVTLDAVTAETYRLVHGSDRFDEVVARFDRWIDRRMSGSNVLPLLVPSFVKANETLHELESFFDTWMRRLGMVLVTGYSHRAGQLERRAVAQTAPPRRTVCRRTLSRTVVLADGGVTTCDQDPAGQQVLGSARESALLELWQSKSIGAIRSGEWSTMPLCPSCDEWHRP